MKFDYIDIGTSNFDTSLDVLQESQTIMLVEPIKYYLDCLPSGSNIIKVNKAISPEGKEETLKVYYIPEHIVRLIDPMLGLRGCNSINKPHPLHAGHEQHVITEDVECIPLLKLFDTYNVQEIVNIKIDTEGCDVGIMYQLIEWMKNNSKNCWPKNIKYETFYASEFDQESIRNTMIQFGYNFHERIGDTIFNHE